MFLDDLEVIVGTYEEFLLGYRPKWIDKGYNCSQTFANHGHRASIRCVASNGRMLASGGADDSVHLYDMLHRKETGILMHHSGTVNCVKYTPNGSHLLTGGNDGMLAILRASDYRVEKTWGTAHKGSAILDISVHPSGKVALTVGADATLRTWNLVKGRQAYAIRVGSAKCGAGWLINGVCWSPSGEFYAVAIGTTVTVYSVESAAIVYSITTDMKVASFCFLSDQELCVGDESGMIYVHDVARKSSVFKKKVYDQRVKGLRCVVSGSRVCVVSASSSGQVTLWEYKEKTLEEKCNVKTGCRVTCLAITTCGYPNLKEEEVEEVVKVKREVDDYLSSDVQVRVKEVRGEVVVIEEEEKEGKKHQKNKRKKKKLKRIFSEMEEEHKKLAKKQKIKSNVSNSLKLNRKKNKKRTSLADSWEVSDVR